jgi:predicted transcriptional regulator
VTNRFAGFTIPDGAFIPPELIYLLPNISGAKLKVLIVVLYHNLQIGGGEPLSLTDIENLSGLRSRQTVISAVHELMDDGMLERYPVGNSFCYAPVVQLLDYPGKNERQIVQKLDHLDKTVQKLDHPEQLSESDRELNLNLNTLNNSLSDSEENGLKIRLVQQLRSAGVYLKTAQDIVRKNDQATIEQHLKYYEYALRANLAQGPGWLVASLKEGWGTPLGYQENNGRQSYTGNLICPDCYNHPCICEVEDA